jgi:conjugative relaxase-like TrwC/TraI family protein
MLRVIVNASSASAKSYYSHGLSHEDYYTKEKSQEIIGLWGGKGSELLGLKGTVDREQFASLCDNLNPLTGEQLTARNYENRRVGYDLNFHAPKSVSLVMALAEDERIMDVFRASVRDTMTEIEKDMQARVRVSGQNDNRETGNLIYGEFIHTTARPVDGVPDPHLHAHCFTFNATYDQVEDKWKAGEFGIIKKDASYFEAFFHAAFSVRVADLGYEIERTEKGWEIAGIDRSTTEKFSNRTREVEEIAAEKGIFDAKAKDQLGAKTRDRKIENLTLEELKAAWNARLTDEERFGILNAGKETAKNKVPDFSEKAGQSVNMALEHCLERKSVADEREVLRDALKRVYGVCAPAQVMDAYRLKEKEIIKSAGKDGVILTTKEAVKEESNLVRLVTEGKGKMIPINNRYEITDATLNPEQRQAISHALNSKDRVIVIEGGAGTGKTTLMKEFAKGVEAGGKQILAFAPSAEASRGVLKEEGFASADTVARLLVDKDLQKQLKGNVLWVDEAGLLGNRQMTRLLEIAEKQKARIILTGDTRQHNSVERGDAMRIIIQKSRVKAARVTTIQRQRKVADYKEAVKLISENKLERAFGKLEGMGAIHEIADHEERHRALAQEYMEEARTKNSVLVVAPTHMEGEQVTAHIRAVLKKTKFAGGAVLLAEKEKTYTVHKNLSPTEAQKKDPSLYREGYSVQFHQNIKGFARGTVCDVVGKDARGNVQVKNAKGVTVTLPLHESGKFAVYEKREIKIAEGDRIRITQNGFSLNNKRLNNGNILTVKGIDDAGNIIAQADRSEIPIFIGKDYRNLAYGYCATSHASQGKTVDKVLIAQSSFSARVSSREQFYVSVSRGKTGVSIYTDNKAELRDAVAKTSQRQTASEVEARARMHEQRAQEAKSRAQAQQRLVSRLATLARVHYDRAVAATRQITQKVIAKK